MTQLQPLVVAVAGNPNAGKSTLINAIAGSRLHVGNWPGVTVEKREARFEHKGRTIRLVDLPGTYSLSPFTQEEIIARDYLVHKKPDLILNVVDSTNLERNLYLTIHLLELGIPLVMALNMSDEAEAKGYLFNVRDMELMLGITVVPTSATRKSGLDDLLDKVLEAAVTPDAHAPRTLNYGEDIDTALTLLSDSVFKNYPALFERYPEHWLLLRLLEGDQQVRKDANIPQDGLPREAFEHLKRAHGDDVGAFMADARYGLAAGLTREVVLRGEKGGLELTEKIDRVVLNRFFGIPIFMAAMWLLFKLTFDLSAPFAEWYKAMTEGPFKRWAGTDIFVVSILVWFMLNLPWGVEHKQDPCELQALVSQYLSKWPKSR